MIKMKENRGITLTTLIFAILIMLIISGSLIYNVSTSTHTKKLKDMYNDVQILKDKVALYYLQYNKLPILENEYTKTENIKGININDGEKYYVIDLEKFDNLTLSYGKEYKSYKTSPASDKTDLYVINEQSNNVYYIKGIKLDNKMYYTIPSDETTNVDVPALQNIEGSMNGNVATLKVSAVDKVNGVKEIKLYKQNELLKTYTYDSQVYDLKNETLDIQDMPSNTATEFYIEVIDINNNIKKSDTISLSNNTQNTLAGTIVELPDEWSTQTMRYVSTTNGVEVTDSVKIASVYAVSTGNGEQVPVPYGFYYVGGNKENGVVISDNISDRNKYAGQTNIGKDLQGNQFVFVPCILSDYAKISWGYTNASGWDLSTNGAEKNQIQKYGGFYVGRYEAGTSNAKFNTDINAAVTASNWQNACYTTANATPESKPTTKAGEIPWFHADYTTAVTMSERMYNTNYVSSGLITGTQWDVMLKWMSEASDNSDLKANCTWGNYNNTTLTDCEGKYSAINTSNGSSSAWAENTGKTNRVSTYTLLSTGSSETAKKKNLYDVAGNLWEWTQETAYYSNETNYFILRGGSFGNAYASYPACYRHFFTASGTHTSFGFRPVLYIK